MKLYGVDIRDHRNFDFVFDTTYSNPTKTMKYVKEAFEQFTGKQLHYLPGMESRANEKTSGDEVISCLHELSAILDFSKKIDNESLDELTWLTTLDSKDDIQNLNTLIKETNVNKLSQLVELLRPDTIVQLAKLINRTDIDNLSILIAQTNPTDFAQLITCVDEDDLIYLISMSKPTQLWRLINKMDTKTLVSLIQRADTIVDFTNTINNCDIDQFVAYTI